MVGVFDYSSHKKTRFSGVENRVKTIRSETLRRQIPFAVRCCLKRSNKAPTGAYFHLGDVRHQYFKYWPECPNFQSGLADF